MAEAQIPSWKLALAAIAVALALIVPAGMAFQALHERDNRPVVKLRIEGYDPRDMLRGHYLTYRYDWNWGSDAPDMSACESGQCCVCLSGPALEPQARIMACDDPQTAQCTASIPGWPAGPDGFDIGHDRFYIPEHAARDLERLLIEGKTAFHIGLSVREGRDPVIERLYVDGVPLREHLRSTPPAY